MKNIKNISGLRSFLFGLGSLGNISGGYITFRRNAHKSDLEAIRGDWMKIGDDMRTAMSEMDKRVWKRS